MPTLNHFSLRDEIGIAYHNVEELRSETEMAYAIGYLVVVAAIAAALGHQRPAWTKRKVVLTTTLPGPAILLVAGICTAIYVLLQPSAPKEIDAGGMAMVAILTVSAGAALGALLGGVIVASLSASLSRVNANHAAP